MISIQNDRFQQLYKKCLRMLGDLGKLIVAKGFKKVPKIQKSPDLVTLSSSKSSKLYHNRTGALV